MGEKIKLTLNDNVNDEPQETKLDQVQDIINEYEKNKKKNRVPNIILGSTFVIISIYLFFFFDYSTTNIPRGLFPGLFTGFGFRYIIGSIDRNKYLESIKKVMIK